MTQAKRAPSWSCNCEQRFLDLCHRVVPDRLQVDMRKVGHLVGRDDAIDDGWAIDLEHLVDLAGQLAGLRYLESVAAAGARQRREIRIGEFDALPIWGQTARLRFQRDQPELRIVV